MLASVPAARLVSPATPRAAIVAVASSHAAHPLKVHSGFGGLSFSRPGPALRARGITIGHRVALVCGTRARAAARASARTMPPARVACGQGLPGITARSGSLDPALASGTVTATADLKFSRGSRSLVVSSARLIAAHGTVSLQIKIGGRYVPLATITPPVRKVVRTVSDISVSGELMLTRPGADALGRTLGTSLRTGSALCAFGGNVVFTQADVSSGSATFSLPSSVTVTPVAPASGSGSTLHLPVRASVVGLSTIASLNGVVRVSGGATLQLGGRTITLSALSVTLNGNQVNRRIDVLHASVAGGRAIAFADLSMGNGGPSDTNATETDAESVKLTGAGAAALGPSLHAGSSFGSILLSATVGR